MTLTRDLVDFPSYSISEDGEVINKKTGHSKAIWLGSNGYPCVRLSEGSKTYSKTLHRLLAKTFIPNPEDLTEVNHIDEDKSNYVLSNLEWCTKQYNQEYSLAKKALLVSPEGDKHEVFNISGFCRERGLTKSGIFAVLRGAATHHKGWKLWRRYGV